MTQTKEKIIVQIISNVWAKQNSTELPAGFIYDTQVRFLYLFFVNSNAIHNIIFDKWKFDITINEVTQDNNKGFLFY